MYAPPMPGTVAEGCQQLNDMPSHSASATVRSLFLIFALLLVLLLVLLLLLLLPLLLVVALPVYTILLGTALTAATACTWQACLLTTTWQVQA
jgi:hypothetical protein